MICLKVPEFRYLHQVACSQIPLRWAVGLLSSFVAVTALCSAIAACWVRRPQLDGGGEGYKSLSHGPPKKSLKREHMIRCWNIVRIAMPQISSAPLTPSLEDPRCMFPVVFRSWSQILMLYERPQKTSDILEQLHQDIDTWYYDETLRNDRPIGVTQKTMTFYTHVCLILLYFSTNIKSLGTMRDTQKTMTISARSFGGCTRFSPLLI